MKTKWEYLSAEQRETLPAKSTEINGSVILYL